MIAAIVTVADSFRYGPDLTEGRTAIGDATERPAAERLVDLVDEQAFDVLSFIYRWRHCLMGRETSPTGG